MTVPNRNPLQTLIAKIAAGNGSNGYYDPQLAAAIQAAQRGTSDINRSFATGTETAKINFDEAQQDLLRQKVQGYQANDGSFSGNGLLRSGIYATEQGRVGEAYQRALTEAAQRRQQAVQQLTDQRLSGFNSIQGQLESAQAGAAQYADQRAQQAALQSLQTQQAQALLGIQQAGMQSQMSQAQQMLALYQSGMGSSGQSGNNGVHVAPMPPGYSPVYPQTDMPKPVTPPVLSNPFSTFHPAIIRRLGA